MFLYEIRSRAKGAKGWAYIGITTDIPEGRLDQHIKDAMNGSNRPLMRAIREFGPATFRLKILDMFDTVEELKAAERQAIEEHKGKLWNASKGGERPEPNPEKAYLTRYRNLGKKFSLGDRVRFNTNTITELQEHNDCVPEDKLSFIEGTIVKVNFDPADPDNTVLIRQERKVKHGREIKMRTHGGTFPLNAHYLYRITRID